jgi:hypothetical protein
LLIALTLEEQSEVGNGDRKAWPKANREKWLFGLRNNYGVVWASRLGKGGIAVDVPFTKAELGASGKNTIFMPQIGLVSALAIQPRSITRAQVFEQIISAFAEDHKVTARQTIVLDFDIH